MRISIWQQFSSNNSSSFTVVGVFENAEAAQRAADEVRQMIETIKSWYNEHPNEAGNYLWSDETSTPPEVEIGNRFGFEWPGAVEWYWNASVEVVLDRLVYITPNGFRPDTAGEPFDKVLTGLGGQGMIDGNFYGDQIGIILVDITCSAPNEETARSIAEEELDYKRMVREEGTTLHFYDWPFEDFDLPEFIEELKGRGCTDIQYRLFPPEYPRRKATDSKDVDLLLKVFKTNRYDRTEIINELGDIGDARAVEPLIEALKNPSDSDRMEVARALGAIGDIRAVNPLIEALSTTHGLDQMHVVRALGNIGDARAVAPLITMLSNDETYQEAANALGKIGEPAHNALNEAALSDNVTLQERAKEALAKVDKTRDGGPLLVALRSEKSNVRDEAFKQIKDTRNSKVLVIFLRETEEVYVQDYIIGQCINLLAELEGIKSIQLLSGQQRNIEWTVRSLTKPNLSAIEELIALAQDEKSEPWLRNAIVISLANSADPHAEAFLIQVLEEDASYPALKTNIMYGLARIGSESASNAIVREFLTGGSNGTMNYTALDPLEKLNALDRLLEPLLDSLDNFDDWLPHRLEALRKIGDKRAIQPLVAALEKAPAGYDRIIRQTLQKLGYEE